MFFLLSSLCCTAQLTIPWGYALNVTFGNGTAATGPPLSTGYSSLNYTTAACPDPGFYTVISKTNCSGFLNYDKDAGHFYYAGIRQPTDLGYMMLADLHPSTTPTLIFGDTIRGLCNSHAYMFWAGILNLRPSSCFYPNFTFSVESTSGVVIQTAQTGNIGGPGDKMTFYPGTWDPSHPPRPIAFYGVNFSLPPGVTDVVVKIIANPVTTYTDCDAVFVMDNIIVSRLSPEITIASVANPNAIKTSACFEGNIPVVLDGNIGNSYFEIGTYIPVNDNYGSLALQWQQSIDDGFTWTDIPGETNPNLSHVFSIPDTFFVRLRGAESGEINDLSCNTVSNVIKVEVDGLPTSHKLTATTPVCTDADLIFTLDGGATYTIAGPNGYTDNSAHPHIYHPSLADSGWYYSQTFTLGGCSVTDSIHVVVKGPDVKVSAGQSICYGRSVSLYADGGNSYSWTPAAGLSDPHRSDPVASPITTTSYLVKVTDTSGCSATDTVLITLRNKMEKAAFIAPDVSCPKDIIQYKDTSQGVLVSWNWDFGNGQASTVKDPPTQAYPQSFSPKFYAVSLIITDTAGCSDTAIRQVLSAPNCNIDVPSSFTPNGDGHNDDLYPLNAYKATHLSFRVYNRTGQQVFETTDWTKKWDGTVHGNPQPAGVYVWILVYTDASGRKQTLKGTTILIR